ncbi:MAG: FitA-like ribbon-helix-helix domain-containing protein [Nocardioides sp.]
MTHVQIRNVPDDVRDALVDKAARAGQSLQQYLTTQLTIIATTPSLEDVLARIDRRAKGRLPRTTAVTARDEERARR